MTDRRRLALVAFVGLVALAVIALLRRGPGWFEGEGSAPPATRAPGTEEAPSEPLGGPERPLALRTSTTVRLLVVDAASGEPAVGVELVSSTGLPLSKDRTGPDGRLSVDLASGASSVEARGPNGRSGVVEWELPAGEFVERTLALVRADAVVRGVVVDPADRPVAGALVKVLGSDRSATTDARGAFVIEGLLESSHRLQVRAEGHEDGSAPGFAESPAGPPLRLVVRPGARLEGQIVARGAEAPTAWRVFVGPSVQTTAAADGRFALDGLGGGAEVHVHVSGKGARNRDWEATRRVQLEPAGTTRATFEVGPPGTLEGRVVRRGGSPAGMTLSTRGRSVVLGPDGEFRLQEVASGPTRVQAAPIHDWWGPGRRRPRSRSRPTGRPPWSSWSRTPGTSRGA